MSKANEIKYNILKKYVDEINKMYKCGCWVDWISVERLARLMNISKYRVRKAFKELAEEGYLKLDKVPTAFQEYDNGLYCESVPWLYCKAYVLTNDAFEKVKELRVAEEKEKKQEVINGNIEVKKGAKMNNKIIINKNSLLTDAEALYKVYQVIGEGLVSETTKGKQYCFATRFKDGSVVTCNKIKTGYSFRVGKEKNK